MTGTRLLWASLLALSSLIGNGARSCVAAAHAEPLPRVRGVGCIGFTVSDVERSADFFTHVLGFEERAEIDQLPGVAGAQTRTLRIRLGRECLDLTEYLAPRGRPVPPDSRSNDRWFQHVAIVVSDMDRAYAALQAAGVGHASTSPQRLPDWNPKAAGIRAFYFHDPDRHVLEVIQFPPGKGEVRWHHANALFLGIDHTAIVIADTEESLRFYRDGLGLRVTGTSENWGTEQEHLNNVAGAHLRITTLRAGSGPGVELLEYLEPRNGRPFPADARSNDLIHWQTRLFIGRPGDRKAALARDPDGHALQFAAE